MQNDSSVSPQIANCGLNLRNEVIFLDQGFTDLLKNEFNEAIFVQEDLLASLKNTSLGEVLRENLADSSSSKEIQNFEFIFPKSGKKNIQIASIFDKNEKLHSRSIQISTPRQIEKDAHLADDVQKLSNVGYFSYHIREDRWSCSSQLNQIFEIDDNYTKNFEGWIQLVKEDQQQAMINYFQRDVLGRKIDFSKKYNVVGLKSGKVKRVFGQGRIVFGDDNEPEILIGTIQEIDSYGQSSNELDVLMKVAEITPNAIIITDASGYITWVNHQFETRTGYSTQEVLGKKPGAVLQGPETDPETVGRIGKKLKAGVLFTEEILNYNKNGDKIWQELSITPIKNYQGEILEFIGVQYDISPRKKVEADLSEKEQTLQEITNSISGVVLRYVVDKSGNDRIEYLSEGAKDLWKIDRKEIEKDVNITWRMVVPQDFPALQESINTSKQELSFWDHNWRITDGEGNVKWINGRATPSRMSNGDTVWHSVLIDISELIQTQVKLEESKKRYRTFVNSVEAVIWEADVETFDFIYVTKFAETLTGHSRSEWLGPSFLKKQLHPEDREKTINTCIELSKEGLDHEIEYRIKTKSGDYKWVRELITPGFNDGKLESLRGILLDITAKKESEAAQKQLRTDYKNLISSTSDAVIVFNDSFEITYCSPGVYDTLGYTVEEYMSLDLLKKIYPPDLAIVKKCRHDVHHKDKFMADYRMLNKQNDVVWVNTRTSVVRDSDGSIDKIITSSSNISEIKEVERKLQQTLKHLELALSSANLGYWTYDFNTKKMSCNQEQVEMLQLQDQGCSGVLQQYLNQFDKTSREKIQQQFTEEERGKSIPSERITATLTSGDIREIVTSSAPILNEKGEVTGRVGINLDISAIIERKMALKRTLSQLELATETGKIGVMTTNLRSGERDVNQNLLDIYQIDEDEAKNDLEFWKKYVVDEYKEGIEPSLKRLLEGNKLENEVFEIIATSGLRKQLLASTTPIKNESDEVQEVVTILQDITELKKKEKELSTALEEKETLFKELHHRIKNNLQMVASILFLKSRTITDPKLQNLIKEVNSQIMAVAHIHESMLANEETDQINIKNYIDKLVEFLVKTHGKPEANINLISDCDDVQIDADTALTVGLMVYEMVSNSLKYAFDDQTSETNEIRITYQTGEEYDQLIVSDNGKGFERPENSVGISLIESFAEQLGASYVLDNHEKTVYEVQIPK